MDQKRLLLAFVLSAIILFGWSYIVPPPVNRQQNANTSQPALTESPTPAPAIQSNQAESQNVSAAPMAPDSIPQRTLIVSTPLYRVEFDSRGAVARSWIILRNKEKDGEGKPLRSVASNKDNPQPLQLISQDGLSRGLAPLSVFTGRQDLDSTISSRNFAIAGVEGEAGTQLDLNPGEQKSVEFS
ncbi:MAG: YidC/Oxa1 family rane protein insertase, partial [Acidobacteriota bacterium]|nr:YidC/Oxa1 family rane protein insertase [Acidobacteriota bacterium]